MLISFVYKQTYCRYNIVPLSQQNNKEIFKSVLAGILSGIFTHETTNCLNLLPSDVLAPEFPDQIRLGRVFKMVI